MKWPPTSGKKRDGYEQASCVCPACGGDARCHSLRPRNIKTLLGVLKVRRHYYHCDACHHGFVPRDAQLRLDSRMQSPATREVVSIAGVQTSFAQSSQVTLAKLCGLDISESTVGRVTEDAGTRLRKLLDDKVVFGEQKDWEWQRDAQGKTCAYVSLDATGIRQQGAGGAKAEGRMAYVGMVYNARSEHDERKPEPHSVRYLSGYYELDELGLQLRRQAAQVGWDEAEQQIALSDGGKGLEEFFRKSFPRAVCILDFWHASEHLVELSQSLYADDEEQREKQVSKWCHQLKHEGGLWIIYRLRQLDLAHCHAAQREKYRECLQYFENHQHRMDYPRYVANGWQIGSGPVESACKTVVGNRLKGGGMRWGKPGSDAVSGLRALYLSQPGCWEAFWQYQPS